MGKGTTKGRYICKVGFYDIYASDSMRKKAGRGNLTEVASTVYNIYHAKKLVDKGFKTKDIAVERAKELITK
jgi:hypothetical protein